MTSLVTGIVGSGMIGRDPFHERCWSGSSRNLFLEMQRRSMLNRAFGVESKNRYKYILKNFSFNKRTWREKLNLDPKYYKSLTDEIDVVISKQDRDSDNVFLQIGAHYDVPSVANGAKCFSYHDGNIAVKMRSPYMPSCLMKYAKKAFEWEKMVSNKMDMVFTMSDYLRDSFIQDYGVDSSKVKNIGVGINFQLPDVKVIKNYSKIEILFIGIDFERKGGILLVDMFKNLKNIFPNIELNIVGPKNKPSCVEGIEGINFYGFLNRDNKSELIQFKDLLQRSSLGVLPSDYEPFGIGVLEMMAYGIPCVLPNKWAFPEILVGGKCGWLYNNNDDFLNTMKSILNNIDVIPSKSNESMIRTRDYSWDHVVSSIGQYI